MTDLSKLSNEELLSMLQRPAASPQQAATEPTAGDRAARVAGLGIRAAGPVGAGALAGGAIGSVVPGVGTVLGAGAGATAAGLTQLADSLLGTNMVPAVMDRLGVPRPETAPERFAVNATGTMANLGGQLGLLGALKAPANAMPTTGEAIAAQLTQQPGRQLAGAATGSLAGTEAAERGYGILGQTAATTAGGMLPFVPQMLRGMPTPEARRTAEATVSAQDAGYRLPPSQTNPSFLSSTLEGGVAGKAATERTASLKNQPVTNQLAKQDLGFPQDKPLNAANLNEYRQQVAEPYREIAAISPKAAKALEDLKQLRADATGYFKQAFGATRDYDALKKAQAAQQQAEAIESGFEKLAKSVGKPDLVERLRQSRTLIAKSHNYEAALNDATGNVDARIVASQFDKNPQLLTGNMATIGKTANIYGPSMRLPENVGPNPGFSLFDLLVAGSAAGGTTAATGSPYGMLAGLAPIARPVIREGLLSKPYQSMMGRPELNPLNRNDALLLGILSGSQQQQR